MSEKDLLSLYLKEISGFSLLSAKEELSLGKKIKDGLTAAEEFKEAKDFSESEINNLTKKINDGYLARNKLIESNYRLVISIAKNYQNNNLPLIDLIQEGNRGLSKAAIKYDYQLKNRFSTYATYYIKQAIERALDNQGRTIRIPVGAIYDNNRIRKLKSESNKQLTDEEIAIKLNLTLRRVQELKKLPRAYNLLDDVIDENDVKTFHELYPSETLSPDQAYLKEILEFDINLLLLELSEVEQQVIKHRYGLEGPVKTLEEVGNIISMSKEGVRKIQQKALKKLKAAVDLDLLHEFYD